MDLKGLLNFNNHDPDQSQSCFPTLSWNQRLTGFLVCCILGYLIQLLSFGSFLSLAMGNPNKFAILYSFGNIIALAGTGFLIGFAKQCSQMTDPERKITSIILICSILGTLFTSLVLHSRMLVLICILIQIPAFIWYCATYIPFARDCIKSVLRGIKERFTNRQ